MDKISYLLRLSIPSLLICIFGAVPVNATSGAYQTFEHGRIYSSALGTFAVIEPLNQLHLEAGGTGVVGFPLADEFNSSDRGRCQQFEFALICERADTRSPAEVTIDAKAAQLASLGASSLTALCGFPAKTYSALLPNEDGVIVYINGQAVYSYGGTLDTFNYYADRCTRFGIMTNDPQVGGNGPFNTPGAYQDFSTIGGRATGRIYWSWRYAGKFVYGTISVKFEQAGGTNSSYGWPMSEVQTVTRNGVITNCQQFEGGEICEDAIPAYTPAQQAFLNVLGTEYLTNQIQTFCGNREKVQISGGIAYYDPADRSVRKVTGAIYSAWGENCGMYGLPENDTTRVTGFGATNGYAQRFNNGTLQFDFYQKDGRPVVILEGNLKNKYDSKGGLAGLGFVANSYNEGQTAAGRCGVSGLFWSLDNGRIYLNGSAYHLVYGNTPIGSYFFNNGADGNFGLPMNDENNSGTYSWQDFSMTRIELWWPGQANQVSSTQYCLGEEPTPIPPTPTRPCPDADTAILQACAYPSQARYSDNESPALTIVHGNAQNITVEISLQRVPDVANHFTYKSFDIAVVSLTGQTEFVIPRNLLWHNSNREQDVSVYYRVTARAGSTALANKPWDQTESFGVTIRTPEYINPLEDEPYYTIGGGIGSYLGHSGIDLGGREGRRIGATKAGRVVQVFTGLATNSCVIPSRVGTPQMILSIEHDNGIISRYMHMNPSSVSVSEGDEIALNGLIGTIDDVGCSTPGYDHLHFEFRQNQLNGTILNPENEPLSVILQ